MDPRTPIIVGVGQVNGASEANEPIDLITIAVERAQADTGGARLPIDLVALAKIGTRQYFNAPQLVADRIGAPKARTLQASHGGHTSQVVLAHAAAEISAGLSNAVVIAGGELGSGIKKGLDGTDGALPSQPNPPDTALGDDLSQWLFLGHEVELGIAAPIMLYPVMETALGSALGRSRGEHLQEISSMWARFSEVASTNEHAAHPEIYSAEEIKTAGPGNRYVGYPYTKLMNSDQFVDQGAAILMCSVGLATNLGISRDRWIFPHASVTAHAPFVSERWTLHDIPVLKRAAAFMEQLVERPLNDIEVVDLYACFPFAVQAQASALGLPLEAKLTETGGMRFAGGPWNNYGTHMIANLVTRLREDPDAMGICSTNGGFATRFNLTTYSGQPAANGFRSLPAPITDTSPRRTLNTRPEGTGTIEGYTVLHDTRAGHRRVSLGRPHTRVGQDLE
jgi:acetyl-CoA C-acetyltransferase